MLPEQQGQAPARIRREGEQGLRLSLPDCVCATKRRTCTPLQGLDKGILFCTFSLLCQKAATAKKMQGLMKAHPERFHNKALPSLEARNAFTEAATGEAQFGA